MDKTTEELMEVFSRRALAYHEFVEWLNGEIERLQQQVSDEASPIKPMNEAVLEESKMIAQALLNIDARIEKEAQTFPIKLDECGEGKSCFNTVCRMGFKHTTKFCNDCLCYKCLLSRCPPAVKLKSCLK